MDNKIFSKTVSLYSLAKWTNGLAYKDFHFSTTGVPIIKIAELKNGITSQTQFTNDIFDESVKLNYDDLLFSWSGNPDTSIDVFRYRRNDGWLNQHIFKVVPNGVSKDYLFYLLKSLQPTFAFIASNKQTTGLGHVTIADLKRLNVYVHSLKEQQHIVDILGSIDEKIENNKKNATTLESLMDALFRKMLNDASDNWKQISLTKMAEYTNGLAMQKYRPTGQDSLPVVKIRELSQGAIDTNSELADPTINNKFTIDDGDIVFAWSGTLLVKIWCGGKAALNQHLFKVTSDNFPSWFLYLCTKQHLQKFQNIAKGKAVTMGHIKREDLEKSLVIIPPERIFSEYNSNIQTLYDKFVCLQQENKKLQELKGLYLKKFFE